MTTREKFEKWALTDAGNCNDLDLHKTDGEYDLPEVQRDFEVWRASRAVALEEALEAVRAERLEDPSKNQDDVAYDMGVEDCANAIRALAKDEGGK